MGNYNPHIPQILGQEWVGIREEDIVFDANVNDAERGHRFTTSTTYLVNNVRTYFHDDTFGYPAGQMICASIYPAFTSEDSGPVQRLLIPISSAIISGNGAGHGSSVTVFNAGSAVEALLSPNTQQGITFNNSPSEFRAVDCLFDISKFAVHLNGKRVLGMNVLYHANASSSQIETDPQQNYGIPNSVENTTFAIGTRPEPWAGTDQIFMGRILSTDQYTGLTTAPLSELNYWFGGQVPTGASGGTDRMNWTYGELLRMGTPATATPIYVCFAAGDFNLPNGVMNMFYVALEVFVCEERRVAFGAMQIGNNTSGSVGRTTLPGQVLPITVRNPLTLATNPQLTGPGSFDVVVSSATPLSIPTLPSGYPVLNALRQLYEIPTHPLVMTTIPLPLDETAVGREFTSSLVDIAPQISVHTTGGTITEPHVYGRQAAARVYSGNNMEQEIFDDPVGVATTYQQLRIYARRYGDTTANLEIFGIGGAVGAAAITVPDFDALPEIINGWKECTLRCTTAAVLGNVANPKYRFATNELLPANRWEVLGLVAPAITAQPSNVLNLVAAPNDLGPATYGAPGSGSSVRMLWLPGYAPLVTAGTADSSSDAVIIFSQDPPIVTGLTITTLSQAVTGFVDCNAQQQCCVPSAIQYNQIRWSPPVDATVSADSFTRTTSGWATNESGQTYTDAGGTVPGNYLTNGSRGQHVLDSANVSRRSTIAGAWSNLRVKNKISLNVMPSVATIRHTTMGHFVDASNYDYVDWRWSVGSATGLEIVIGRNVGGSTTDLTNISAGAFTADQEWWVVMDYDALRIRAKAWLVGTAEPHGYQAEAAANFTSGGYGFRSIRTTGNTNGGAIASYDDVTASQSTWAGFGSYELQRRDPVDGVWQTIMLATSPTVTGFKDYEARVGVTSQYQIRQNNVLNFHGSWSITGTGTISEPGVTLPTCGTSKRGVLIFTSNETQNGTNNLAYAMVWEDGQVREDFNFIESGSVQFSQQFNRNFQIAFHGTERGGESFTRELLLANAAVALPRLGNMHSLRDMAWANAPYVCVRDDIGDRWFASVLVQDGTVRRKRRIYNSTITVVEVTDTPSPVDPL